MKKTDPKTTITKEFQETVMWASTLAFFANKKKIRGDELFLAVGAMAAKLQDATVFWKVLWLWTGEFVIQYLNQTYKGFTGEFEARELLPFSKRLCDLFESTDIHKTYDVLDLLSLSIHDFSPWLRAYFAINSIDVKSVQVKLKELNAHPVIKQIGLFAFVHHLSILLGTMHLDFSQIDQMVIHPHAQIDELLNGMEQDLLDKNDSDTKSNVSVAQDWKEEKKLTIEYFGTDLTRETSEGQVDPVIGRDKEIQQVIYTLLRKTKNNPLLIGEPGVGKTAIIEGLAKRIVEGNVPEKLKNKRIFMLDMGGLVAGTKYRGEFEARLKSILEEAADMTNNIILFIDEIHTIIGAWNAEWGADTANMLKPLLARGKIKLIGATTYDEYQKHIEKDAALKRRFQEIHVDEPSVENSIAILQGLKKHYEDFHGVVIADESIQSAVALSKRYMLNKHLPDKAFDILDEACARKSSMNQKLENDEEYHAFEKKLEGLHEKLEKAIEKQDYFLAAELKEEEESIKNQMKSIRSQNLLPKHLRQEITITDIGQVLADKLWIPANLVTESEVERLKRLEPTLKQQVVWQEEAIEAVMKALKRNRLSIVQKNKPIASFLFLGASGTGKTHLAKTLAKEYFGDESALIRVDMSEFMEKYSVSKLIGSAPGYVGYDEGGLLTEQIRRKPYSVVLFDEIEKASKDVLNILLQILDEGHLKDNKGRRIDFKSTILILTSNIGSDEFSKKSKRIGFTAHEGAVAGEVDFDSAKAKVLERLRDFMLPELLNRLDYTLVFKPLTKPILAKIFKQKLDGFLQARSAKENVKLPKLTGKKVDEIIDKIYDPQFGARPIERYIFDEVEPMIIDQLMK